MSQHTRKKLSLRRETLRDLTADQLSLVAGALSGPGLTNVRGCERSGFVGHCEIPSHWVDNCGPQSPGPAQPGQTLQGQTLQGPRTLMQTKSIAYCLDKPPLSGRTLPPGAMD